MRALSTELVLSCRLLTWSCTDHLSDRFYSCTNSLLAWFLPDTNFPFSCSHLLLFLVLTYSFSNSCMDVQIFLNYFYAQKQHPISRIKGRRDPCTSPTYDKTFKPQYYYYPLLWSQNNQLRNKSSNLLRSTAEDYHLISALRVKPP